MPICLCDLITACDDLEAPVPAMLLQVNMQCWWKLQLLYFLPYHNLPIHLNNLLNTSFEAVFVHVVTNMQHGHSLMMSMQEWQSSDGSVVPIQCIMDVVGNAFNSNNPAGLPVAQSHLMPLIQDSKKGPAIDLDAFLLVMLEEHLQGRLFALPCCIPVYCHAPRVLEVAG